MVVPVGSAVRSGAVTFAPGKRIEGCRVTLSLLADDS